MKISNETKVGILAIVAILALVLGFNFLKGKKLFSKTPVFYAVFDNLGGLEKSNQVKIKGLTVGTVYDIRPINKQVDSVLVEIHMDRDVNIPNDSKAFISASLVGASGIVIEKGAAKSYYTYGDTLSTRLDAGLIGDLKTQISPTLTRVNTAVDSLTRVLGTVNAIFDHNTNNNLRTLIAHLAVSSAQLQNLLNSQDGALAKTLNNMNLVSGNLAANNPAITRSIQNLETTTSNLAKAEIPQTVEQLKGTISQMQGTVEQLKGSVQKLNSPDGTLGALINDRKLYDQLNRVGLSLEILSDDIRVHPKRYVNISLFGGKNKGEPLTSPAPKDTLSLGKR
jgi:phospholipid/cholesterol/gamma-HCH transport system substrate-binding protein